MVDILDEAREELREEKLKNLLHKFGKPVLLVVVLLFAAGIIKVWYTGHQETMVHKEGAEYFEGIIALKVNETEKALAKFSQAAAGKSNYAALGEMAKAAVLAKKGDLAQAKEIYSQVSYNKAFSADLRDYSKYMAIYTDALNKESDKVATIDEIDAYLQAKPVFVCSAIELKALLFAELGKRAEAAQTLAEIKKDICPEEISLRARRMQVVLSLPEEKK